MSYICTCIFSFPIVDTKICSSFFFLLGVCQVVRLNKAPRWVQPQSGLLISVCPRLVVGDFMSELVIITGDCILTFSLRSISEGTATLVSQRNLYICFSSPYLLLTCFHVEGKKQAKLRRIALICFGGVFFIGNVTYCCSTSSVCTLFRG